MEQVMVIWRFLGVGGSTLRPSGGQNMRLSQFSIADSRSAQKTGRFDILTSKTKIFFEIMVSTLSNFSKSKGLGLLQRFNKKKKTQPGVSGLRWGFVIHRWNRLYPLFVCLFVYLMLQIRIRSFWVISTPSSGQKW